jgi:predicted nucleic acid-binding protein
VILVDTSVLVRLAVPQVAEVLYPLLESGAVATCGVIDLELLSRIAKPATLAEVARVRSASFHWLATWDADLQAAIQIQHDMVETGLAAACWPSRVIAAVARRHGVPVLRPDRQGDRAGRAVVRARRRRNRVGRGAVRRDACDLTAHAWCHDTA